MRTALVFGFSFCVALVFGQDADSLAAAAQVDSLIKISRDFAAKRSFEKALEVNAAAEKVALERFGRESAAYGSCCFNRGRILHLNANYPAAEMKYLESLALRERHIGKQHPDYAHSLNNLAVLYWHTGNYEKAEQFYLETLTVREKVLGKQHPDYATSLNNTATLYFQVGNYKKAEPLYIEALSILGKTGSKQHPAFSASLNNLASIYYAFRKYEKAEPLYLEALDIQEKTVGKQHPDFVKSLNNLGLIYRAMGNWEKAEHYYAEALEIQKKSGRSQHPDFALHLNNLAMIYMESGNYEKALPLFVEALTLRQKTLGKEHTDYTHSLLTLAQLYQASGQFEKAEVLFNELSATTRMLFAKSLLHLSENELNKYLGKFSWYQDVIFSFALSAQSKKSILNCLDNALFYKGFLLQAAGQTKRLAFSDSSSTREFTLLQDAGRRIAAEYSKPLNQRDSTLLAEIENQANELEKDLVRTVAGYGEAMRQISWQEIQAVLKPDEAAIEFVAFDLWKTQLTDSTLYIALVLLPNQVEPFFIPLFEERQLATRFNSTNQREKSALYAIRGAKPLRTQNLSSLYEVIWQPLESHLSGAKTIYFSPSGLLHRLNLAAIPINLDSVLADRYNLVELGSTRQLVIPATVTPAANDAVLFGGIQYDADSTAIIGANAALDSVSIASRGELNFSYTDSTLRVGTWSALPFTDREVNSVEKTLKTAGFQSETRRGFAATEEAFKTIGAGGKPSPRVLHLATHGFFFPDPKASPPSPLSGGEGEPVFRLSDHPMIRSGLILAGANHAWATGKPLREGMEDGILTAYEISQMNLSNTELVVLSACETGLGDIQGNEGVYGLQRAFKIAGAKYLIMSLWQVDDQATMKFMEVFYRKWLEGKMPIPDAFRATQAEMRERFLNPYLWAGFVLVE